MTFHVAHVYIYTFNFQENCIRRHIPKKKSCRIALASNMMKVCRQKKANLCINANNPIDVEAHMVQVIATHLLEFLNQFLATKTSLYWLQENGQMTKLSTQLKAFEKGIPAVGGFQRVCLGQTMTCDTKVGTFIHILHKPLWSMAHYFFYWSQWH